MPQKASYPGCIVMVNQTSSSVGLLLAVVNATTGSGGYLSHQVLPSFDVQAIRGEIPQLFANDVRIQWPEKNLPARSSGQNSLARGA